MSTIDSGYGDVRDTSIVVSCEREGTWSLNLQTWLWCEDPHPKRKSPLQTNCSMSSWLESLSHVVLSSLTTFDENLERPLLGVLPLKAHNSCVCVRDSRYSQTTWFYVGSLQMYVGMLGVGLIPYLRLCESVIVKLHLSHGHEVRLISGNGCFWKIFGQIGGEGTPSHSAIPFGQSSLESLCIRASKISIVWMVEGWFW